MNSRWICEFKMHLMSWFMKSIRQMDRHKLRSNGICLWVHRCMLLLSMPLETVQTILLSTVPIIPLECIPNCPDVWELNCWNELLIADSVDCSMCLQVDTVDTRETSVRHRRIISEISVRPQRDISETFPNDFKFMDDFEFADSLKKFAWHFESTWWPERCEVASSNAIECNQMQSNAIKCKSSRCRSNECESYECESSRSYRSVLEYWVVTHNLLVHVATLRDSKGALDSKV